MTGVYDVDGNRLGELVREEIGDEYAEPVVFLDAGFGPVWVPADDVTIREDVDGPLPAV